MKSLEALERVRAYSPFEEENVIIEKDLKALAFIKSFFDISCNGTFNTITFANGNTRIVYFCKSREEYEELRKML